MKRFGLLISGLLVLILLLPLTAFAQDDHHPGPPGEIPDVSEEMLVTPETLEILSLIEDLSLEERGELLTVLLEQFLARPPAKPVSTETSEMMSHMGMMMGMDMEMMRQQRMERMRSMMGAPGERPRGDEYARMLVLLKMLDILSPEPAESPEHGHMMMNRPETMERPRQQRMDPADLLVSRMEMLEQTLHELLLINQRILDILEP